VFSVFVIIHFGCPEMRKNVEDETTKRFSVGNTKVNILALTAGSKNKILVEMLIFAFQLKSA